MSDRMQYIELKKIKVLEGRTREELGDIEGLAGSIMEKGLIVPLILNKNMELDAGGRRYEACMRAKMQKVPVIIRDTDDKLDSLEIELIENTFRKDFTWDEYSKHIKKLHDYCEAKNIDWSQRKTATLLNEPTKNISRAITLATAMEELPELAKCKTQDEAEKVIKRMHEEIVVGELRRRQENTNNRGMADTIKIAKANYHIGDCFKGMAELKTNGMIHFIELDTPYAIELDEVKKGKRGGDAKTRAEQYNEISHKDFENFMPRMARETYRVANFHAWMICWFGPTHFTFVKKCLQDAKWIVNDIPGIWVKPSGQTMAPEYNLANCYEPFFICRKGQPVLSKRGHSNVFQYPHVPDSSKYHPTQRPLELMSDLLSVFTIPMQICLIPCLGSGVTLRSCYLSGLKGFGYDLSDKYLDKFLLAVEEDTKRINSDC